MTVAELLRIEAVMDVYSCWCPLDEGEHDVVEARCADPDCTAVTEYHDPDERLLELLEADLATCGMHE